MQLVSPTHSLYTVSLSLMIDDQSLTPRGAASNSLVKATITNIAVSLVSDLIRIVVSSDEISQ